MQQMASLEEGERFLKSDVERMRECGEQAAQMWYEMCTAGRNAWNKQYHSRIIADHQEAMKDYHKRLGAKTP
jgi:hypothetical protein